MALTAEFLVDSIHGVTENTPLRQEWVGLILLPIVGNAAGLCITFSAYSVLTPCIEHVTAVTVSVKVNIKPLISRIIKDIQLLYRIN